MTKLVFDSTVMMLLYLHETKADVAHYFPPEFFVGVGYLIQSHSIKTKRLLVILLLHANIAHVHFETPGIGEGFVSYDNLAGEEKR